MIYGRLNAATGELTDLSHRCAGTHPDDVPLASMPAFAPDTPLGYDAPSKSAIPLPKTKQTDAQRLGGLALDGRLVAALALRASASWAATPRAIQARAQKIIDDAGAATLAALS